MCDEERRAWAPLAQSESKAQFLKRLGLSMENALDKALYARMKAEAVAERERMHLDRANLQPHMRTDPGFRSPYNFSWLTEMAIHRAVLRVYEDASPTTKPMYELGRYTTIVVENWVIRWLLWHVFRYRDARQHRRLGVTQPLPGLSDPAEQASPGSSHAAQDQAGLRDNTVAVLDETIALVELSPIDAGPQHRDVFDPVRDEWR